MIAAEEGNESTCQMKGFSKFTTLYVSLVLIKSTKSLISKPSLTYIKADFFVGYLHVSNLVVLAF